MALLEVDEVTVRFGGLTALHEVSIGAEAGTITGLIGPNGAGKTTLFNVVTGLQAPTGGRVVLDGTDLKDQAPFRRARRGMARTFQRLELFGLLTARENLTVAADIRQGWESWLHRRRRGSRVESPEQIADRLLEQLGIADIADERADVLSTGHARLVELGRALASRPRVLLLDEPASGQDDRETERFASVLSDLAATGIGVILVEHDMKLVMSLCSTIHVLDFGSVLASGDPSSIQANPRVVEAYLGHGSEA
jgi:branched-chain amino acid transport system ATP-binding protein